MCLQRAVNSNVSLPPRVCVCEGIHVPQDCSDIPVTAAKFVVKLGWLERVFAAREMLASFAGRHLCHKMGSMELGTRKQEDAFLIGNGLSW